jgi:hypothetical protein
MPSARLLPGTTNESPRNHGLIVEKHHRTIRVAIASLQHNQYPPRHYQPSIAATTTFSTSVSFMGIYIKICLKAPTGGKVFHLAQTKPFWLKIRACTTALILL